MDGTVGHVISPRSMELCNIGTVAYTQGKLDVAYLHFMAALVADDQNHNAWQNLGAVLSHVQKSVASEVANRRALELDPGDPGKMNNVANTLMQQRRYAEATRMFVEVIRLRPQDPGPRHNIGMLYYTTEKFHDAVRELEEALRLNSNWSSAANDLAMARLATGEIQAGLKDFEIRWKTIFKSKAWELGIAEWQGEPLAGKRILVHHEQGFGDTIMLSRFIPVLMAEGALVTIAVPKELIRLFRHNFPSAKVLDWDEAANAEDYDFHSPMLSVVRWLGYAEPDDIISAPYLSAPGEFVYEAKGKFKVGLCWASGNHGYQLERRRRIIALERFLPIAIDPDIRIYSLQKGAEIKEIEFSGAQALVFDALARAEDFADTADVIMQLDLVVTIDSAVAHLAGALGKPVIMLGPYPRCWRWWGETDGLPWYRDMQIVQQAPDGSWDDAIEDALVAIRECARE